MLRQGNANYGLPYCWPYHTLKSFYSFYLIVSYPYLQTPYKYIERNEQLQGSLSAGLYIVRVCV